MESSQATTSKQIDKYPFPINIIFSLPLVCGLEGRLKYVRTLNKIVDKSKPTENLFPVFYSEVISNFPPEMHFLHVAEGGSLFMHPFCYPTSFYCESESISVERC